MDGQDFKAFLQSAPGLTWRSPGVRPLDPFRR